MAGKEHEQERFVTRVAVIGATGYTGGELLRLLQGHPDVELAAVSSRERAGTAVSELFPSLRGHVDLSFRTPQEVMAETVDVVFYATPHGVAMHSAAALLERGIRVIDLSADFRIKDIALWEQWYKSAHAAPDLVEQAVYGLPEVNRAAIAQANLVAVPGCYPTAVQLGFLPLLEEGLVDPGLLIADAKSGVSGAGRKAVEDYLLCETSESIRAYGVSGHRHHPEISQGLSAAADADVGLTFVPHLTPMIRGILATLYSPLKSGSQITAARLQGIFEDRYATESFVDVLPPNSLPATRDVTGSNRCSLSVNLATGSGMVVVVAAIDNLIKGAAGQAVQSLNIMLGLDETSGLDGIPPSP